MKEADHNPHLTDENYSRFSEVRTNEETPLEVVEIKKIAIAI
jgi:hypothetical protein